MAEVLLRVGLLLVLVSNVKTERLLVLLSDCNRVHLDFHSSSLVVLHDSVVPGDEHLRRDGLGSKLVLD